jgi:circadian clock protein KaiC
MRSVGLRVDPWVKHGLLRFQAARPTTFGLEMHLAIIHRSIVEFDPGIIVIDPITNLLSVGETAEVKAMLTRLIDYMKGRHITALFTSLTGAEGEIERTDVGISSLMDTWILLSNIESSGERNRGLYVLKSRGMAHSNQIREFNMSHKGIELTNVYLGAGGVLTGAARVAQESREKADAAKYKQEIAQKRRELDQKRQALTARIAELQSEYDSREDEIQMLTREEREWELGLGSDRYEMARIRQSRTTGSSKQGDVNGSQSPKIKWNKKD